MIGLARRPGCGLGVIARTVRAAPWSATTPAPFDDLDPQPWSVVAERCAVVSDSLWPLETTHLRDGEFMFWRNRPLSLCDVLAISTDGDEERVAALAQALLAGEDLPPILIAPLDHGAENTIFDGYHRCHAHLRVGHTTIAAFVHVS